MTLSFLVATLSNLILIRLNLIVNIRDPISRERGGEVLLLIDWLSGISVRTIHAFEERGKARREIKKEKAHFDRLHQVLSLFELEHVDADDIVGRRWHNFETREQS